MTRATRTGPTAERFVETTLDLIAERGGSEKVNLREVSRRMGCAHTNLYNYYPSYQDLLWEAFRRSVQHYGVALTSGLDPDLGPASYLEAVITNLARYPEDHPGRYRLIASDPMPISEIPEDILATVSAMKQWLADTVSAVSGEDLDPEDATRIADIVLAYIDGETLNLINERTIPDEDVHGRITENALRMHRLLVLDVTGTGPLIDGDPHPAYPTLVIPVASKGD